MATLQCWANKNGRVKYVSNSGHWGAGRVCNMIIPIEFGLKKGFQRVVSRIMYFESILALDSSCFIVNIKTHSSDRVYGIWKEGTGRVSTL